MQVEITKRSDIAVVQISGDVDSRTSPELREKLLPLFDDHAKIVIDLSGVTFLSSAGLRILLLLYRHGKTKNAHIVLAALPQFIKDVMSITGFLGFFHVTETLDDGIQSVQ